MSRLRQVLKGIKVECGKRGKPSCSHLSITSTILRKLKAIWLGGNNISFNDRMLWVASLTTFLSFCLSGKVTVENEANYDCNTHLSFSDVAVDNAASPSMISLNIKCSKTDQVRVDCQVVFGKTGDDLCPIVALLDYLARRGKNLGHYFNGKMGYLCPRQGLLRQSGKP